MSKDLGYNYSMSLRSLHKLLIFELRVAVSEHRRLLLREGAQLDRRHCCER